MFPQIFPLSLNKLLALSDRVQKFSMEMNGTRTCHGCDRQAASLKKCAKCSLFWYCNGVSRSSEPILFNWDANLITIRPVRALAGMRKATSQTASFPRMPILRDCFLSIGIILKAMLDFLWILQQSRKSLVVSQWPIRHNKAVGYSLFYMSIKGHYSSKCPSPSCFDNLYSRTIL